MCVCVCGCVCVSCLVVSDSLQPHRLESAMLLCPWDFSRQEYWSGFPFPSPGTYLLFNKICHFIVSIVSHINQYMGLISFSKYLALSIFSEMLQKGLVLLSGEILG